LDRKLFKLSKCKAKTKVQVMSLCNFLFADDAQERRFAANNQLEEQICIWGQDVDKPLKAPYWDLCT